MIDTTEAGDSDLPAAQLSEVLHADRIRLSLVAANGQDPFGEMLRLSYLRRTYT